ncbi:hypothetical protein [Paenirhodobacter populi]|uniref:hypothetical protein n=1 Tax=Paenirhodobacter populi TaxID=2306993 RepID=UPI000FE2E3DD|nr:hypothetical protein [Sinirhodobacter populi]RWR09779.1 hypothetical protein D2T32_05405 [Sinirhodobacter populi]
MSDRQYMSGWWILPGIVVGVAAIGALATCAHAATGGADTPIFQCFDLPPMSENGIGPLGAPAAVGSEFVAIPGVYSGFTDAFFASLTQGYVPGGKSRPEVVTSPGSDLPAVPLAPAISYSILALAGLIGLGAFSRRKK